VHLLDAILFMLLLVGNLLALPVWWRLFGAPLVWLWMGQERGVYTASPQVCGWHAGKPEPSQKWSREAA